MVTQGVIEAQAIQFWYGILDNELKRQVRNVILLQLAQPILVNVFQLLENIKMNMVEERVVTQGKPKEFSNTIKPIITKLTHQGYTTQGQRGQTKLRWWFHILFNKTRWKGQMLEVWWVS